MQEIVQRADPAAGSPVTRLWRGASYLAFGWRLVRQHPPLARLCLAPVVVGLVTFGGCLTGLLFYLPEVAELFWPRPSGQLLVILWMVFEVLVFVGLLVAGLALSYAVQCVVAAPFNDLISERVERLVLSGGPPAGSWGAAVRSAGRAVAHEARKVLIWLSAVVPLFILSLIVPVVGALIWSVGSFYLAVRFVSYDALDYSMGRRAWSFSRKVSFLREHRAATYGLGASTTLLLAIPVLGLAASPLAAAGGTALFCDLQPGERSEQPAGR